MKRAFDIMASAAGLLVLLPLLFVFGVLIKVADGGSIFYRGVRVGRYGKNFRIYKFRTMVINAEKLGGPSTADDDARITKMGETLRRYKLDELPQLINILKGEMSLVGPRPEIQEEVALYTKEEKRLLNVRPGMTDYASIQFHNEGEILRGSEDPHQVYKEKIRPEKIRLGLKYVHNHSLWIDLELIKRTIKIIFGTRF